MVVVIVVVAGIVPITLVVYTIEIGPAWGGDSTLPTINSNQRKPTPLPAPISDPLDLVRALGSSSSSNSSSSRNSTNHTSSIHNRNRSCMGGGLHSPYYKL